MAPASSLRNSATEIGSSSPSFFALRTAFSAERRKFVTVTPGTAWGYWNARKSPRWARSSAPSSAMSSPSSRISPSVIV